MTMQGGFNDEATLETASFEDEVQPEASSGDDEQESSVVTPSELRALIQETMRPLLDSHYRGTESQIARIRNEFGEAVQAIARLQEEVGDTREVHALVRALTKQSVTPEEIEAEANQLRSEAESRARERELAQLRKQAAARQTAAAQDPAEAAQSEVQREFRVVRRGLVRYATAAGIDLDSVAARVPQQLGALPDGTPDWDSYIEQVERAIDEEATQKERAARVNRPRATPDTTRPAGEGSGDRELLKRAAQPNEYLTPAELARVSALHAKQWG